MKNKNLALFVIIGFILTTAIWGFVGGCGTSHVSWRSRPEPVIQEEPSAEGVILDKTSLPVESQEYIVELGDTLWGISKRFGVSISSIKEANKLSADTISVGQRLVIPGGQVQEVIEVQPPSKEVKEVRPPSAKPGLAVYKVKKDDSLWRIAQIYGTTIEHIAEINGLPKSAKLKPGQEILVPSNE